MPRPKPGLCFYFRNHEPSMHIRDLQGGHVVVQYRGGAPYSAQPVSSPQPWYNRVDWLNNARFNRNLRSQSNLKEAFDGAAPGLLLQVGPSAMPASQARTRRVANQGMNAAMQALFHADLSATQYANHLGFEGTFEWCHLLAHSMHGGDGPGNIVVGTRNNNSEQLILENLLWTYNQEPGLVLSVAAKVMDTGDGRHMGDVIRYTIRDATGSELNIYFDCLAQQAPTRIRVSMLTTQVARWLNQGLVMESQPVVTRAHVNAVLDRFPQFAEEERDEEPAQLPRRSRKRPRE